MKNLVFLTCIFLSSITIAAATNSPEPLIGLELLTGNQVKIEFPAEKKTILIFMAAKCPCSGSHESLISELKTRFKDFQFYAVHSNSNETIKEAQEHFAKYGLTVINDSKAAWANRFGALKTPHAFVLDQSGEVIYQGGVTDSHVGPQAKTKYLEEVLQDLTNGKNPRRSEGRALGCYIQRGNS